MLWLALAFTTACCESLKDVLFKQSMDDLPTPVLTWALFFFGLPFLVPLLLLSEPVVLTRAFWWALVCSVLINSVAVTLYIVAIRSSSDLSTTIPMIAFTPLFLLLTSPLLVGEFPGAQGIAGVLLVVAGSYVLNIRERSKGYLAPYRALLREQGPRLMLLVAFLWSIAANLDKIGLRNSAPVFWLTATWLGLLLVLLPFTLRHLGVLTRRWSTPGLLLLIGFLNAVALLSQLTALSMTLVAYVIAIKRTSTVMSVLWGGLLLREAGLRERLTGVLIMLAGVVLIALA